MLPVEVVWSWWSCIYHEYLKIKRYLWGKLAQMRISQEGMTNSSAWLFNSLAIVTSQQSEAIRRAEFSNWWRCCCFFKLIFSREWSNNEASILIEDSFTSYFNGRGKCILITTWKFRKKCFWRIKLSLQVRKITCVRCGISLDKNWFFSG